MDKLYFIPGSQDLYGEECLKEVLADCKEMVDFLNEKLKDIVTVELLPTVVDSPACIANCRKASTMTALASSPGCIPSRRQRCG